MRSASRFRWYIPTTACRMRTNLATVTMRPAFFDRAFFVKSSKTIIEIPHRHTSLPNCSRFGTKVFRLLNDSNTRRGKQQQSDPTRLLEDAMECLRITAAPTQLVCRESERAKVLSLLSNAVTCGSAGAALYISGMPGTGKSATIHAVLKEMKELSEDGELPSFEAITINAMSLSAPDSIYTEIYRGIFKTRKVISRHAACRALDSHFRSGSSRAEKKRPVCVLVIDEVDSLVTAKQRVLYTLFDWPTCPNSRLVVVTIANTMDLPERMIPRCASRLGTDRRDSREATGTMRRPFLAGRRNDVRPQSRECFRRHSKSPSCVSTGLGDGGWPARADRSCSRRRTRTSRVAIQFGDSTPSFSSTNAAARIRPRDSSECRAIVGAHS
eukprot:Polyplicarium_translucidae@DN3279_c1_g2_i3.p2